MPQGWILKLSGEIVTCADEEDRDVDQFCETVGYQSREEDDQQQREINSYSAWFWSQESTEDAGEHCEGQKVRSQEDHQMSHQNAVEQHHESDDEKNDTKY